jgi:hypothetical protein
MRGEQSLAFSSVPSPEKLKTAFDGTACFGVSLDLIATGFDAFTFLGLASFPSEQPAERISAAATMIRLSIC